MGNQSVVMWDESVLDYDLGGNHPLHPIRLDLTMRLARSLGVLDGITMIPPQQAGDDELERVHLPEYLKAVRRSSQHR